MDIASAIAQTRDQNAHVSVPRDLLEQYRGLLMQIAASPIGHAGDHSLYEAQLDYDYIGKLINKLSETVGGL
jgi:hypothetical protein